jgi:hypothetical protein
MGRDETTAAGIRIADLMVVAVTIAIMAGGTAGTVPTDMRRDMSTLIPM